jgi:hypothetical protein
MSLFCLDQISSSTSRRGALFSAEGGDDRQQQPKQQERRSQHDTMLSSSSRGCSSPPADNGTATPPQFEAEYTRFPPLRGDHLGGGFGFGGGFLRLRRSFGSNDASEPAGDGPPTTNDATPAEQEFEEEGAAEVHEPRHVPLVWHHRGLSATLYKLAVWMHQMNREHSHVFFVGDQHGVLLPVDETIKKRKDHDDDRFDPAEALLVDSYPSLDLTLPESSSGDSSESSRRSGRHHHRDVDQDVAAADDDAEDNDEMGSSTSTSSSMSLSSSENDDYNDDCNDDGWAWEEKDQNNNNNSNDSDYFGDLERGGRSSGVDEDDDDDDDDEDDEFEYDEEGVEV